MKVKELKKLLMDLPEDAELFVNSPTYVFLFQVLEAKISPVKKTKAGFIENHEVSFCLKLQTGEATIVPSVIFYL